MIKGKKIVKKRVLPTNFRPSHDYLDEMVEDYLKRGGSITKIKFTGGELSLDNIPSILDLDFE